MIVFSPGFRNIKAPHMFARSDNTDFEQPLSALADPGRGPMIFLCPKRHFFSFFSSLASLAIHFKSNFNRYMAKSR